MPRSASLLPGRVRVWSCSCLYWSVPPTCPALQLSLERFPGGVKVKPAIFSHLGDLKSILKIWFRRFRPIWVMGHLKHQHLFVTDIKPQLFQAGHERRPLMLQAVPLVWAALGMVSAPALTAQPVPLTGTSSSRPWGLTQGVGCGFRQRCPDVRAYSHLRCVTCGNDFPSL